MGADGQLRGRFTVAANGRGYCWTYSFMNPRAYRCFKGNSIMDPCWKESDRNSVACLLQPWSTRVTRLRLTKRLPRTSNGSAGIWGLRLGGGIGANCLAVTGATIWIDNLPVTYFCPRGWVLLDSPDRHRGLWTIKTAKSVGTHYEPRGRRPLSTAWRAAVR